MRLYTSPDRVINFKEDENIDSYKTTPSSHSSDNFNSGDDYYNETTIYRCTTLCDKVCHWLATGLWFSLGTPVSSTNKTDSHDITEILLKLALNTIKQTYNNCMSVKWEIKWSMTWIYMRILLCDRVINFKEDENIDSYKTTPSSHSSDNFNSGDDYYNETTIYRVHITVPE
jgi:hypothetical protein